MTAGGGPGGSSFDPMVDRASTPIARARRWRDEGLAREEVRARLLADGLEPELVPLVLANAFGDPMPQREPERVRPVRGAGFFALVAGVAGAASGLALAVRLMSMGAADALLNHWVLGGNAVAVVACVIASVLDTERARAFSTRAVGLGALAALPATLTVYASTFSETEHMKAGATGATYEGAFMALVALAALTYFFSVAVVGVRMLLAGSRRSA